MPTNPIRVPDFRMLAKAFPEERHSGDVQVCTIGFSAVHRRLIRWPTVERHISRILPRWQAFSGMWNRPARSEDTRVETLIPCLDGEAEVYKGNKITTAAGIEQVESLFLRDGIEVLKTLGESIGIVRPVNPQPYWTDQDTEDERYGIRNQPKRLRVKYMTEDGRPHDQTILDWQYYEAVRRFTSRRYEDPHSLAIEGITNPASRVLFVVGNIARHPHSYVVVGVLTTKMKAEK